MTFSKSELIPIFKEWLKAWNEHNLEDVMNLMHEDVVFENWNGSKIKGKKLVYRSWAFWFKDHGNFNFIEEELFFDEETQKMLFMWKLEWPSQQKEFKGKPEIRRGVDVMHFQDRKIIKKYTYSKTTILIAGNKLSLE